MNRRILVIDDEYTIRTIVQTALEVTHGWQILQASNATAGLDLAQSEQPDAILLDVMMPELDGFTLLKRLQSDKLTQNIPVIFFTARARDAELKTFQELGIAGVIIKPFEPSTLGQQIQSLLQWSD